MSLYDEWSCDIKKDHVDFEDGSRLDLTTVDGKLVSNATENDYSPNDFDPEFDLVTLDY